MLLSTQTDFRLGKISIEEMVKIISDAGFDAYDLSFFNLCEFNPKCPFSEDDYLQKAKALRAYTDSLGIVCNQAHAPFPSSFGDEQRDEIIFKTIVRSMEIAAVAGAKIIVVHPKQHLNYAEHAEELFELNVEFYKSLIPYAEKFGIKIATENMWQCNNGARVPSDSTCSRAWEFCKYIDAIDSEWLVGCLDIGHASLMAADIPEFIRTLGKDRLRALHIHDTDFKGDLHTLPFMAKIDYIAVAKALGEIGYEGDFTFEADEFARNKPDALLPATVRYMCEVGRYLISVIEENKA